MKIIIDKNNFSKISKNCERPNTQYDIELQTILFYIMLCAVDKDVVFRGIELKAGQACITTEELHNVLKFSYPLVNKVLQILEEMNFIETEYRYVFQTCYCVITIINCPCYEIDLEGA